MKFNGSVEFIRINAGSIGRALYRLHQWLWALTL